MNYEDENPINDNLFEEALAALSVEDVEEEVSE